MSTCDHICRECGQVMNCQHCKPWQLPADRERIRALEVSVRRGIACIETLLPYVEWDGLEGESEEAKVQATLELMRETVTR